MKKETIQLYDGLNVIINVNTDTHKIEISRFDKLLMDLIKKNIRTHKNTSQILEEMK